MHVRVETQAQPLAYAPERDAARLLVGAARAAEDVREASWARALHTLTKARDLSALLHAQTERERAALAEMQERRGQVEREAEAILVEAGRVEGEMQERRVQVEREAEAILAGARAEADRVVAVTEEERRVEVEREADEIRAEVDRVVAATEEERRVEAEREAEAVLARARVEADSVLAGIEERRVQAERQAEEILEGARIEDHRVAGEMRERRIASDAHGPGVREAGLSDAVAAVGGGGIGAWLASAVPAALLAGEDLPPRPAGGRKRGWAGRLRR